MQVQQKLLPALILGVFASSANAAGFQLLEQNASGIGNAYAGSAAVAENASTIFYNPAGMMELRDREVSVGLTAIKPSFKFTDNGSSNGGPLTGNGTDAGQLGFVPNGYLSWAYSKDLRFGIGIGAPFGLMTKYDGDWVGAAQSLSFDVKTLNVNPSVAYRVNDWVSVGFGLNYQRIEAEYKRRFGTATYLIFPAATVAGTTMKLALSDESMGWNAGALLKLAPDTKLGLSYRSQIKYTAKGQITATGGSALLNAALAGTATADITLPDNFIASLTKQLNDRWEVLGDLSWTGWSSIPKIDIYKAGALAQTLDTNFRNTWRIAAGATYKYSDDWKLKMGVAYDQTPVKDASSRLVSLPDNDRVWLSMGAQWKVSKDSLLDFGLAYLYVKDATISNDQSGAAPVSRGTVSGTYKDSGWILGAQYSTAF